MGLFEDVYRKNNFEPGSGDAGFGGLKRERGDHDNYMRVVSGKYGRKIALWGWEYNSRDVSSMQEKDDEGISGISKKRLQCREY